MPLYDTVSDSSSEEGERPPQRNLRLMMTRTEVHKRIKYHQKMIHEHRDFKRLTKKLKIMAMQQYAKFNGVDLENFDEIIELIGRDFGYNEKQQRERFFMPYLDFANSNMASIRAMHAAEIEELRQLL